MSIGGLIGWQGISSVAIGVGCGVAEFTWHTIAQKIAMVVTKLEFKPSIDPDDGPQVLSTEALDKQFVPMVVLGPIIEETVFRGLLQPMLAYGLTLCFPQLATAALLGISKASLLSVVTTGVGFGLIHYSNYEKGGAFPTAMSAVAGVIFGVVREKFGLVASVAAHMTANLGTGLLDKHWPEILEFSWEKELRLLPPKQRELRLLQEAVQRVDTVVAQMSQNDRTELEQLCSKWKERIRLLKAD